MKKIFIMLTLYAALVSCKKENCFQPKETVLSLGVYQSEYPINPVPTTSGYWASIMVFYMTAQGGDVVLNELPIEFSTLVSTPVVVEAVLNMHRVNIATSVDPNGLAIFTDMHLNMKKGDTVWVKLGGSLYEPGATYPQGTILKTKIVTSGINATDIYHRPISVIGKVESEAPVRL